MNNVYCCLVSVEKLRREISESTCWPTLNRQHHDEVLNVRSFKLINAATARGRAQKYDFWDNKYAHKIRTFGTGNLISGAWPQYEIDAEYAYKWQKRTKVLSKVRKYESTFVRKYESTKVRKYESTKVLSYESTFVLSKVSYESTFESTFVLSYAPTRRRWADWFETSSRCCP